MKKLEVEEEIEYSVMCPKEDWFVCPHDECMDCDHLLREYTEKRTWIIECDYDSSTSTIRKGDEEDE